MVFVLQDTPQLRKLGARYLCAKGRAKERPLPNVLRLPLLAEDKNGPYVYLQQARLDLAIVSRPVIATSMTNDASDLTPL